MGLHDAQSLLADAQAVTTTDITDNVIDLGATNTLKNIAAGQPLYAVVRVNTAVTSSGDPAVTFTIESDSTENLATSATTHGTYATDKAGLTAGTVFVIALQPGQYERYLGGRVTVGSGGPLTAGAFTILITDKPQQWQAYADAL